VASTGTPSTGRSVRLATMPGRWARPAGAGDDHLVRPRPWRPGRRRTVRSACGGRTPPWPHRHLEASSASAAGSQRGPVGPAAHHDRHRRSRHPLLLAGKAAF
jgi:hypothetical protein